MEARRERRLAENELHLWCLPTSQVERDRLAVRGEAFLSADERRRQQAISGEVRARRYLLGRVLLREALGYHLGCEPGELAFGESENGKLYLIAPEAPPCDFCLSHSRSQTVVAVALAKGVGVDIEPAHRGARVLKIARHLFPLAERRQIEALNDQADETALSLWTLKESVTKALGRTIWQGLSEISLSVRGEELVWLAPPPQGATADWILLLGRFCEDHHFAVALWQPSAGLGKLVWKSHQLGGRESLPGIFEVTAAATP
jgi:phosphopantetheinyl transferase